MPTACCCIDHPCSATLSVMQHHKQSEGDVQGNMHVRFLDWAEAVAAEQLSARQGISSSNSKLDAVASQAAADSPSQTQTIAPHVQSDETFDVIIGTDIMYEVSWRHMIFLMQLQQQLHSALWNIGCFGASGFNRKIVCCQTSVMLLTHVCLLCRNPMRLL